MKGIIFVIASCGAAVLLSGCVSGISRTGYRLPPGQPTADITNRTIVVQYQVQYNTNDVELLGSIHAYDTGFSVRCDEPYVLGIFCEEGRILGADIVDITDEIQPGFSTCYRARAQFLRFKDREKAKGLVSDARYTPDLMAARSAESKEENKRLMETALVAGAMSDSGANDAIAGAIHGLIGGAVWLAYPDVSPADLKAMREGTALFGVFGGLYEYSKVEKNSPVAKLRERALNGDVVAQRLLGVDYENGHDVPQNYADATRWYQLAANRGDAISENNLGSLYQYGLGNATNYTEAVKLYGQSAAQGFPLAQSNLGYMYDNGLGVTTNKVEALKWYRRAADQNYPGAMFNLGLCYMEGDGFPPDLPQAYMWLNTAESLAQSSQDMNLKHRIDPAFDALKQRMTADQIAEGQRLSKVWNDSHPNAHQ